MQMSEISTHDRASIACKSVLNKAGVGCETYLQAGYMTRSKEPIGISRVRPAQLSSISRPCGFSGGLRRHNHYLLPGRLFLYAAVASASQHAGC
jgi:hypothetical protein